VKRILVLIALAMSGCTEYVPTSEVSKPTPIVIGMKYLGPASSGIEGDPINGCRVYAFKLEGYFQTAVYCPSGRISTASAAHQKSDDDDTAATQTSAQ
jgi:hypothetical protein